MKKLAIVSSHPIQYNAPLFKLLADRGEIDIKVFYTWGEKVLHNKYDPGFNKVIEWDIPLLNGYTYEFVLNTSKDPGSHHFNGIINPTLCQDIEQWGADAVLVFGWSFKSHLKCIRYFHKKIPVYFRGDSTLLDEKGKGFKVFFKRIFLRWVYKHVDKVLYVGKNNKEYFLKFGVKENQLLFAPHAIENERFSLHPNNDFRKELSIPEEAVVFLFAGKFEHKKNPKILLEAFSQINHQNAYLVMVGNGNLESELKSFCHQLDESIRSQIRFMNFQNQSSIPDVYQMADVLVLPSKGPGETWGLAVNEAMASGSAVLVSNRCGCMPDLIVEGKTGYSFESGNLNDLISKMNHLLDKECTQKLGMYAKAYIKDWSFEKIAVALESLALSI